MTSKRKAQPVPLNGSATIRADHLAAVRTFALDGEPGNVVLELGGTDGAACHFVLTVANLDSLGKQLRLDAATLAASGVPN